MPKFSNFDSVFGHNHNWTFNPFRRLIKSSTESKQEATGDSPVSEPNKRETSDQDESQSKRVTKSFKCPTEPFIETLRILDELF